MTDKKILIADDEANVRLLVSRALGQRFLVLEAQDGEEAIKIARTHKPDLILMDLMMPRVDGNSACSIIKNDPDTKQIPVVMMSGVGIVRESPIYMLCKEVTGKGFLAINLQLALAKSK
jgi:CheY-like chemotaxis protein